MRALLALVAGLVVGYWVVTKAAPSAQAWYMSLDLDEAWDVFNEEVD